MILIYTDMKAIRFIVAAFLTLSVAASCQPSAEELAKQYKDLAVELAQARLMGLRSAAEWLFIPENGRCVRLTGAGLTNRTRSR